MSNLKAASGRRPVDCGFGLPANVRPQLALADCRDEGAHFGFLAAGQHLNAAIRQIAHPADDVETLRDAFDRPAKTDALNVAFKKNSQRNHDGMQSKFPACPEARETQAGSLRER